MKIHQRTPTTRKAVSSTLKTASCLAAACVLLTGTPVLAETAVFGQSDTILRMGQSTGENNLYPLYEYLRISAVNTEKNGSATSLHVGGWGRVDLADKTRGDYTDGDLQYGFISHQGAKNNLVINAGRQFVNEGVAAAQRLDGLYVHSDFAAGFGAAAYVGSPVITEPNRNDPVLKADDFMFGGRITHSVNKYYTLGVSALRSFDSQGGVYREEEGLDVWVHPIKQVDITGRSAYNSVTEGWMEHAYAVSYSPMDSLRLAADYSYIGYRDYFYRVTTSALSYLAGDLDQNEELSAFGAKVSYTTPIKNLSVAADYKHFNYEIAKTAHYYGGNATYALPDSFMAGFSLHRMDGKTDRLNFLEFRAFASKKIAQLNLALDFINLNYDERMSGLRNVYTIAGAASYDVNEKLKVAADVDYSKNPDFDNEVKGLVKLTYAFDTQRAEGRSK